MFAARWPSPLSTLLRHAAPKPVTILRHSRSVCTTPPAFTRQSQSFLRSYRLALGLALPVIAISFPTAAQRKPLQCAGDRNYAMPVPQVERREPPGAEAQSIVNWSELSFGTVSGVCVGVFVKKGLKAVAFALGGVFVLMQYFSSRSFISINWSALTSSYDSLITRKSGVPTGGNRVVGLWGTFVDFVTADVQSRATFVAGMLLGFRIG